MLLREMGAQILTRAIRVFLAETAFNETALFVFEPLGPRGGGRCAYAGPGSVCAVHFCTSGQIMKEGPSEEAGA